MAQDFTPIQETDTLAASLPILNNNIVCIVSNFSGTTFPTLNIYVGMTCVRTDQNRVYRLTATGPAVWTLVERYDQTFLSQELADARYFRQSTNVRANLNMQSIGSGGADAVNINFIQDNGLQRWALSKTASGDLAFQRYDASGNFIDTPITIRQLDGGLRHGTATIWDSANDGNGSGLDADILRGVTPTSLGLSLLSATDPASVFTLLGITGIQTGHVMFTFDTGTVGGFVRMNGRTIGNAASSATERANADCYSLFTWLWTRNIGLTVSGGRGANADADWNANKTIALPDCRGRVLVISDHNGQSTAGVVAGATNPNVIGGAATHALTSGENGPHTHANTIADNTHAHLMNFGIRGYSTSGSAQAFSTPPGVDGTTNMGTNTAYTGVGINNVSSGSGTPHNNVQPYMTVGGYIKL